MADTIFKYLSEQPDFKTFMNFAAVCDDLPAKLQGNGPFTLFVPTDKAFIDLPPGSQEKFHNDNDLLQDILNAHILLGAHDSKELSQLAEESKTLMSEDHNQMSFIKENDTLWVGTTTKKAKVITADIHLSNGVIHVIDVVLAFQ
ncbi:MAG: fasciclin domain-containing protein [Candidatus Dojkabacteria bacterium]